MNVPSARSVQLHSVLVERTRSPVFVIFYEDDASFLSFENYQKLRVMQDPGRHTLAINLIRKSGLRSCQISQSQENKKINLFYFILLYYLHVYRKVVRHFLLKCPYLYGFEKVSGSGTENEYQISEYRQIRSA